MSRELERMRKQSMAKVEATQNIIQKRDTVVNHINQVGNEYKRVTDVSRNAPAIVENIDRQFKEKTKLTDWDIKFLFLCTAMQCARQCIHPIPPYFHETAPLSEYSDRTGIW